MSISTNAHAAEKGWTAKLKQRGPTIWITVEDGEDNDITFFFNEADHAERVVSAFNYRTPMFAGSIDAPENGET